MNNRGFAKIVIILVILIILGVLIFLFINSQKETPQEIPIPSGYNKQTDDAEVDSAEFLELQNQNTGSEEGNSVFGGLFGSDQDAENQTKQLSENPADAPVPNPIDTPIPNPVDDFIYCPDSECFNTQFMNCAQSGVTITYESRPQLQYYYEVLGPEGQYCKVKSYFLSHEDPAWVGPEMICLYNNHLEFTWSTTDLTRCEGELYNLMTGQ